MAGGGLWGQWREKVGEGIFQESRRRTRDTKFPTTPAEPNNLPVYT